MTSRNTDAIDIMVSTSAGLKALTVQVKTRRDDTDFSIISYSEEPESVDSGMKILREKVAPSPNKFYAFVEFSANAPTEYFVVPSPEVLRGVEKDVIDYLGLKEGKITAIGRRSGKPHKFSGNWTCRPPTRFKGEIKLLKEALTT